MAEVSKDDAVDTVEVATRLGSIKLLGRDVVFILIVIGLYTFTAFEHFRREQEHEQIACMLGLEIWIHNDQTQGTVPRQFANIPKEYWHCLPSSIYETLK